MKELLVVPQQHFETAKVLFQESLLLLKLLETATVVALPSGRLAAATATVSSMETVMVISELVEQQLAVVVVVE